MEGHDAITEEAIAGGLKTRWLGRPATVLPTVSSTNDRLQEMAAAGAPAGTMVIADFQSAGRGRKTGPGGRRWEAPAGSSLLLSLLFRPQWPAQQAPWLTMIAGVAVAEAVEGETGLSTGLKWPNDLMLRTGAGWGKSGGLLLESQVEGQPPRLRQAILGLGLNVNIPPEQLPAAATPATSLLAVRGRPVPRLPLLLAILERLEMHYQAAERGQSPFTTWNRRLITRDHPVQVRIETAEGTQMVTGIARGADEWGRLLVEDAAGRLHSFSAGDVTLRAP